MNTSAFMRKILLSFAIMLLVANIAVWHAVYVENRRKYLTVAFMDVGQGDAIFIETPNGNQVVIDGGPSSKILNELGALMPWYDKTIDMLVITNPDKDHIAGFVDVLRRFRISYLLESGTKNKSLVHQTVQELVAEKNIEKIIAGRGMKFFLDEDAILTVLFPDKDVSKEKPNDGSIVMRLKYGDTEIMLTGDAPISVEKHLISLSKFGLGESKFGESKTQPAGPVGSELESELESDILKVGHHGSKTSTSAEFLTAVDPKYAVISSGKENKYGHPSEETLATLKKRDLKILRTDELGTIVMKSDGKQFWLDE